MKKTKPVKRLKIHYSYGAHIGQPERRDLNLLATCSNINGGISLERITSDVSKVTCGRCLWIRGA